MPAFARLFLFTGILAAAGCGGVTSSWGVGGGTLTKSEGGETTTYTVERLLRDGRPFAVLAVDAPGGATSSGGMGDFRGTFRVAPGREVAWSCKTADGKAGTVVIDGAEFDLAKGGLFLVDAKATPARTEQLATPADRLQAVGDVKQFPDLARDEPKVAAFLETCKSRP